MENWSEKKNEKETSRGRGRTRERENMELEYFTKELEERQKVLENGLEMESIFAVGQKHDFFGIFNSFKASSSSQRCNYRILPKF